MKPLSIILTCGLLGVMGWLVLDSRSEARGARNQLDFMRKQQLGAGQPTDSQIAEIESRLLNEQLHRKTVPPVPVVPVAATPPLVPATEAAAAPALPAAAAVPEPPPLTARQRQIMAAPVLAEVKHYERDYGFVEITAGSGKSIEKGMAFAIRRGPAIIGRVKVTEVDQASAVADVNPRSLPPGIIIEVGDEVIQDLPPES